MTPAEDLARFVPRLLALWRRQRRSSGPADTLAPAELKVVAAGVERLSRGLTRERELAGARYLDDPALLGAYLLFYWPVSYAQARSVLAELPAVPRSALDLGAGPGPLAFAALDAGAVRVTAVDRSPAALSLARALADELRAPLETAAWDALPGSRLPDGEYDLITVGHLLNELYGVGPAAVERRAALVEGLLARLKPGGSVVILEPALRETSRALLEVRDLLVARGAAVRAPCLWRGGCPALERENDWCHAERPWSPPSLVEQIARASGLHKDALKMSYLVLAPTGEPWPTPPDGRLFRIVSEPLGTKGRARFVGCGPEGRVHLVLPTKHLTAANAAFFSLQRGDLIRITTTLPKGDGLALAPDSPVTLLARPGGAIPKAC